MASDPVPDVSTVWEALRTVFDPEIGENVVDLGLVYRVDCVPAHVHVDLTMTTPACPAAGSIAEEVEEAIRRACPEAREVNVVILFDPPWTPERMSADARKQLGIE